MVATGGEDLDQLEGRLGELSERGAAHAQHLVEVIRQRRSKALERGMNFAALNADTLLQKLKGNETPFIFYVESNYGTPAPGTLSLLVGVDNPDPVDQSFMYVHFFVGPGSLSVDVDQALALADTRFPRAVEPEFAGLSIPPFSDTGVGFQLPISGQIEESHYFGNLFLVQLNPFELPGVVLDRTSLVIKIQNAFD